ncbi:MAG: mannitol-1-phosphate 5-dehydrogenase [Spirochaetaceae bacterium]|jgi:mannitol-1-phosphate 5-dehydrogenase|nr:mannitol-1-phosphate 5-dehydrogenase [Spirochaetaceae bacterium]
MNKKAIHFGAGNIGRGFIGEVLCANGFAIDFADVNDAVVTALHERGQYTIGIAAAGHKDVTVTNVRGIHSVTQREKLVAAFCEANLITTAIGADILPRIAPVVADGILRRMERGIEQPLDVIACENKIGASEFLYSHVQPLLGEAGCTYAERYIGFPNAAVDRIVPPQKHDDPLYVEVEAFHEWIVDDTRQKARDIQLTGVEYVPDLLPYIERKLFTVNTGHASAGYAGLHYGHTMLDEALADSRVISLVRRVLAETGALLRAKWQFDEAAHNAYIAKIIARFQNPAIKDPLTHAARSPIRKLGWDERFIRPIRELKERGLPYDALRESFGFLCAMPPIPGDDESARLHAMFKAEPPQAVIQKLSGLTDTALIAELAAARP